MSTAALRQEWLDGATALLRAYFTECAAPAIPENVRVNWGFPSIRATSAKKKRIGECFSSSATQDGFIEIFLHPVLAIGPNAAMEILAVQAHELVHAAVGNKCGHKGPFRKCALAIKLEGKMTSTTASAAFKADLQERLNALGPFPTSGLDPSADETKKKQSTRMLKCECAVCGYTVRVARKWLDDMGLPHCPAHGGMDCEEFTPDLPPSEEEDESE